MTSLPSPPLVFLNNWCLKIPGKTEACEIILRSEKQPHIAAVDGRWVKEKQGQKGGREKYCDWMLDGSNG